MSYGIMFWGNFSHSSVIFKMQKRVIRIIMGYGYREPYRELFKELKILTLSSQCVFSLLLFIVNNRILLFQIVFIITIIPDKEMIYTCLMYLWPCIRKEFIIQALQFLTVFPRQLRISPASLKCLKLL